MNRPWDWNQLQKDILKAEPVLFCVNTETGPIHRLTPSSVSGCGGVGVVLLQTSVSGAAFCCSQLPQNGRPQPKLTGIVRNNWEDVCFCRTTVFGQSACLEERRS